MWDQATLLKVGEDFLGKGWKVICITFVKYDPAFEVDLYIVALLDRIDSLFQLDHGKTVVDRVSKEDAGEPLGDSYPSPAQVIGRCAIGGRFVLVSLSGREVAAGQGGRW